MLRCNPFEKDRFQVEMFLVLQTANFQTDVVQHLDILKKLQPDMPLMVTEFWSGWFDHWTQKYHAGLSLGGRYNLRV